MINLWNLSHDEGWGGPLRANKDNIEAMKDLVKDNAT